MAIQMTFEIGKGSDHAHALAVVAERLAGEFPGRDAEVGAIVAQAFARTVDARVQSFRVLLAERDARTELRRTAGAGADHALRATA